MTTSAPANASLLDNIVFPAALAERLGTTERSLSEWRIKGRGPKYIRTGRRVVYDLQSVNIWLRSQEHSSTSEEML